MYYGRSLVQLQKWRSFSVSATLFQNASTSFSPVADVQKGSNFTISYLAGSLGLSTKLAESISRRVSFEDKGNPDSVLSLFRSHGFTDSQISNIVSDYPQVLIADAEICLGPRIQLLKSRGASTSDLTEILSKVPKILGKKCISDYYESVKCIIEADKTSSTNENLIDSFPHGTSLENKVRNISVLRSLGMPLRLLLPLLTSRTQPICGKENFDASLKKVVEMGFDPTTQKFVTALRMLYQMSGKTIEEKVQVYKSLGFTVEDVWGMFRSFPFSLAYSERKIINTFETFLGLGVTRDEFTLMIMSNPRCIGLSAEALERKTEFLVKKMNWPLEALVLRPQVYNYSMEKTIVPRSNVIKALMSRKLLRDGVSEPLPLSSVFACTDQAFLNRYVMKHDDKELVAELMAIFTGGCAS